MLDVRQPAAEEAGPGREEGFIEDEPEPPGTRRMKLA